MIKLNPLSGAGYLLQGLTLLPKKGIFAYVIIPIIINAFLFGLALILAIAQVGHLIDWVLLQLPSWLQWLDWIMWPLFMLSALIAVFFAVAMLANIIASPFNDMLADAVERHLTGQQDESQGGSIGQALAAAPKAIIGEFRKLGYFLKFFIPLTILSLIPGLNLISPLLWFVFGSWMLALQYCDYPFGNHDIPFSEQRTILAKERMLTLGFGAACTFATLVPLLNFIAIPASVAGATVMLVKKRALEQINHS